METILKVECEGDVRRALLTGTPSFVAIDAAIQEVWPGHVADGAKYMDDDGDSCTLKQQTFTDFLTTGRDTSQGQVLRLRLSPLHGGLDSSAPTAQRLATPSERVEQGSEADDKGSHHMYTVSDLTDAFAEPADQENDAQDQGETPPVAAGYPMCVSMATGVLVPPPPVPTALRDQDSDTVTAQSGKRTSAAKDLTQEKSNKEASKKVVGGCQCPMCNPGATAAESSDDEQDVSSNSMRSKLAALQAVPAALKSRLMESARKASASASAPQEDLFIDLEHAEKIDLVLAAFDESGDGYLNFDELADLNNAAEGDELSLEVYEQMCVNEGEDPDVGLGKEALMCIYNRCRSLEMDFNAAKKKLEGALKPCTKRRDSVASSSGTSPKKRDSISGSSAASPSRPSVINLAETMAHSMDTPTNSPRANAHSMDTPENSPREHVLDEGPTHNLMGQSDSDSEASPGDATAAREQEAGSSDLGVSGGQGGDCVIEHDHAEKIDLVLAAFDTNGDGHLSFDEVVALNSAGEMGELSREFYTQMCENEGEDPDVGLGKEALMCVYNRCRSIEIDFEAAKAKLEDAASAERTEEKRRESQPINHLFKNPMLAVPFALDAAERLRNGVAATLNRNRT